MDFTEIVVFVFCADRYEIVATGIVMKFCTNVFPLRQLGL